MSFTSLCGEMWGDLEFKKKEISTQYTQFAEIVAST